MADLPPADARNDTRAIPETTLEYWALIAEIARAIAIVVSVIYLGVQIRANTKVLRSQAHYNALSLAQRPFEMAIADQSCRLNRNVLWIRLRTRLRRDR
jgi:hypothetical protein